MPEMPTGSDILVAIPCLNEAAHIEPCLRSLMLGDARLADVCFVVADGGSTDATRAIVARLADEFPEIRLIDNPGRLQSAGVNRVAEGFARGRTILVRCDAHAVYPPGYVTRVADALVANGAQSLATPMDAKGESCFQKANAWVVDTPLGSGGSAHRGGKVSKWVDHGHHAGFDLATFLSLGGYDESFSHNEDGEYDQRLAASGGRIFLDAGIRIDYTPRATLASLARQYWNYGKGRARTIARHSSLPRLRQIAPVVHLLLFVVAWVAGFLIHPAALGYVAFYFAILVAGAVLISLRHRSLCGLLAAPAAAAMHFSWGAGFLCQFLSRCENKRERERAPLKPADGQ